MNFLRSPTGQDHLQYHLRNLLLYFILSALQIHFSVYFHVSLCTHSCFISPFFMLVKDQILNNKSILSGQRPLCYLYQFCTYLPVTAFDQNQLLILSFISYF